MNSRSFCGQRLSSRPELRGQLLQIARPVAVPSIAKFPVNKHRTAPLSAAVRGAGARRHSTLLVPSSEAATSRQTAQVRNAAEKLKKKSGDGSVVVLSSNVTVFSRPGRRITAAEADQVLQIFNHEAVYTHGAVKWSVNEQSM